MKSGARQCFQRYVSIHRGRWSLYDVTSCMGFSVKGRGHCEWCGGLCEGGPCKEGLCQETHQYRDPLPGHGPLPEQWRPPKRVVRILLECILVLKIKITPFFFLGNVQLLQCLPQLLVHIRSKCPTVSTIHLQAKYTALTYSATMRHITKCLFESIKNLQCYELPRWCTISHFTIILYLPLT